MRISSNRTKDLLLNSDSLRLTVVSLYSELPPSMMISPASRRGTWRRTNAAQSQLIQLCRTPIFHNWFDHISAKTTDQFVDEVIHSLSGLDQQDDPPGLLQLAHHVLQRLCSNHLGALRLVLQEVVHLGHGSVVSTDLWESSGDYWVK